jgi:hypothetical protein
MAGMFAEAGEGLAKALAAGPATDAAAPGVKPAERSPVDETIRKILEGK